MTLQQRWSSSPTARSCSRERSRRAPTRRRSPSPDFTPTAAWTAAFGTAGKVINPFGVPLNTTGVSLHLLSNGRLLVAGTVDNGGGDLDFYVGRLLDNGDPDPTFGPPAAGGAISFVAFDLGADDSDALAGMTVDRSGRIYLVGSVDISATDIDFGVARLTASGFLDSEFSGDGKTTVAVSSGAIDLGLAVDVDNAGRVILSGAVWTSSSGGHFDFALARLLSGGILDSGFGLPVAPWRSASSLGEPTTSSPGQSGSGRTARSSPPAMSRPASTNGSS